MSNLSNETRDKIWQEAKTYARLHRKSISGTYAQNYVAGATEWAERAQGLVEFIEYVINFPPAMSKSAMSEWVDEVRKWGGIALAKYKEVSNG